MRMNLQSRVSVCVATSVPTIMVPTQLWWTTAHSGTSSNCPASKDCLPISGESQEEWEEESSDNFSVPPPGYNPMNPPPPGVEQPPGAYAASSQAGGMGEGQFSCVKKNGHSNARIYETRGTVRNHPSCYEAPIVS